MSVSYSEKEYKNYGRCICLEDEKIRLIAALDFGPRIIYFGLKGEENILFEDIDRNFQMDTEYGIWYTYGGHRVWKSPEVVPETYFPDNDSVDVKFEKNILEIVQKETVFGKQFSMIIKINEDSSVDIENRIKNCLDEPQRFAPWSITALTPGGTEYINLNTEDTGFLANRTIALWPYSKISDKRFELQDDLAVLHQDETAQTAFKVGFNVVCGEAEYIKGNQRFIKKFDAYNPDYNYPDYSCNFETYTNKYFIECEVIGDEREYMPGESAIISEKWIIDRMEEIHE